MVMRSKDSITLRWLIQSILGILLLLFLGVHLAVNHWVVPEGLLSYADVVRYYRVPGIPWMEISFLLVVTAHCLLGVHAILLDLALPSSTMKILTWLLVLIGLAIAVYGVWLTWIVATF